MTNKSPVEQTIRLRAYHAWLDAGRVGDAETHWFAVERDLRDAAKSTVAARAGAPARSKAAAKPKAVTSPKGAGAPAVKAKSVATRARKAGSDTDAVGAVG